jgi:iron complex outermembrane receptor protein
MVALFLNPAFSVCRAQTEPESEKKSPDFTQFSLEELKNVEIISASKKPVKLSETPAAVYVITQDDIRRSGATSIPEALRLAPGVHVARITATDWAVNIRGLNNKFAQNLLVLIDGRSVYTHVFSGVFWDIQDTVMEDIERIEVIRGPGAALWGANAVNGVINIITKRSQETQGWQTVVLGGNKEQIISARYGGDYEQSMYYRGYAKFFNRGNISDVGKNFENDFINSNSDVQQSEEWRSGRAGFRTDITPGQGLPASADNSFTLQGEAYRNRYDKEIERQVGDLPGTTTRTDTSEAGGGHLLGRWQHTFAHNSETILQVYYDHATKDYDPGSGRVNTADVDFQHRFSLAEIHEIVWGLEYRHISDEFDDSQQVKIDPEDLDQSLLSTFIQDEFKIVPERLSLILGSKFEHNAVTGLEIQPNLRMLYLPHPRHSLWAAVSRAVRVPSRLELEGTVTDSVQLSDSDEDDPVDVNIHGDSSLGSEKLLAYELGYRFQPSDTLWADATVFYNVYEELIGLEQEDRTSPNEPFNLRYNNNNNGQAYGFELASDWQITSYWLLSAAYTYLHTDIDENEIDDPSLADVVAQGSNPRNQISLRSNLDITRQIDFDFWLRYVDNLPEIGVTSYTTFDARLAWRPMEKLELSLVGQNLFEKGHEEYSKLEVDRSIYAKVDWQF